MLTLPLHLLWSEFTLSEVQRAFEIILQTPMNTAAFRKRIHRADILTDTGTTLPATLSTIAGYIDTEVASILAAVDTEVAAILADTDELQKDWANGGRLDLILDARASQASVDTIDNNVDAILIDTAEIGTKGAGLSAIPWNASWDAEVQSEVQDAIEANHLDHLLAVTYDPASKPGAADALLNELVENDGGVARFTANALEEAPTGGSAPSASEIADEVETRTIAAVTLVNGLAANTVSASALADDAVTEIQNGLATATALSTVSGNVDAILADTGTDGVVIAAATQQSIADTLLGRTVTEGFSTAGADATVAQMLHEIRQNAADFSISGTTLTVKRKDGSTTAMTFTLDNDTNPTSRARAT